MLDTATGSPSGSDALNTENDVDVGLWLDNVSLDFPIFGSGSRSIRKALLGHSVGGRITSTGTSDIPVIRALKDINLTFGPGDRVGLIGHNGAGKTTLLRVLASIYHPTGGSIKRHGITMPLTDIQVGYDDEATGYEMILLRGLLMGLSKQEISEKAAEIVEFSELGAFIDLPMRTYSTGMTMRLFFSIATALEGDIVLMDEWIFAGDENFMAKADERLNRLVNDASVMVIASHSREIMKRLCTRGVVLHHGEVVADGDIDEAYLAYEDALTAGSAS